MVDGLRATSAKWSMADLACRPPDAHRGRWPFPVPGSQFTSSRAVQHEALGGLSAKRRGFDPSALSRNASSDGTGALAVGSWPAGVTRGVLAAFGGSVAAVAMRLRHPLSEEQMLGLRKLRSTAVHEFHRLAPSTKGRRLFLAPQVARSVPDSPRIAP
jgi:hypothetical protein